MKRRCDRRAAAIALVTFDEALMTVLASCLYQHGLRILDIAIDERVDCPLVRSQFAWIRLCDPCAEEIATLAHLYDLNQLAVEDARRDG